MKKLRWASCFHQCYWITLANLKKQKQTTNQNREQGESQSVGAGQCVCEAWLENGFEDSPFHYP